MVNYNIVLVVLFIITLIFAMFLVFMTYEESKEILKNQFELSLIEFHSDYLKDNYHLRLAGLNDIESLDEAMVEIKSDRDIYDRIPEDEIIAASFFLKVLKEYSYYQKRLFKLIIFMCFVQVAIQVALAWM